MIVKIKWLCNLLAVRGIMLFPFAIVKTLTDEKLKKHESIHFRQALCTGLWLWYLPYFYYHFKYGYRNNPYEVESFCNQHNKSYRPTMLSHRRYIGKTFKRDYFKDGKLIPYSDRIYYTE